MKFNLFTFDKKHLLFTLVVLCQYTLIGQSFSNVSFVDELKCDSLTERSSNNNVTATVSGFPEGTIFQLELSAPDRRFTEGLTVILAETTANGSDLAFNDFQFPNEDGTGLATGSETYRIRIITNIGNVQNPPTSRPIAIYFFNGTPPVIVPSGPGGVLCQIPESLSVTEETDEFEEYIWTRGGEVIEGETGSTLLINEVGVYQCFPNFGSCNNSFDEALSNRVDVRNVETIPVSISIAGSASFCASESRVLSSALQDNSLNVRYQWAKDGDNIIGATESTFTVEGIDAEGVYTVGVIDSSLGIGNGCVSLSNGIAIDILNPSIEFVSDDIVFLIPGTEQVLEVETQGDNQVITWMLDAQPIPNSNTRTLLVNEEGVYTAMLEATSPCDNNGPFTADGSITVQSPNSITPIIGYNDPAYDDCDFEEIILQVTEIRVGAANGDEVVIPESNYEFLDLEWVKFDTPTGETESSLLIDNTTENGDYLLRVTFGGNEFDSNVLPVVLNATSFDIQQSEEVFTVGSTLDLFIEIPEGDTLSNYQFQWIFNGAELDGETDSTITITNTGLYSVLVKYEFCDEALVGPITISTGSPVIPSIITPNGDAINDNWVLPGEFNERADVEINIYTSNGELDYSANNYNGEWPTESSSNAIGTIYYYVISRNNSSVEQGSITIIR